MLFTTPYSVVLTFESVDEILTCDIQMQTIEQYFPVVLFITTYNLVLTFQSVNKILKCGHSNINESYQAVLSCCSVYYDLQGGSDI